MGFRRWASVVAGSLTGLVLSAAISSAQLPDNWQSLSTTEFASAVETTLESGSIEPDVHDQVKAHAASLLIENAPTESDYSLLLRLQRIGRTVLHKDPERNEQLAEILRNREDDWTGKPYAAARGKITLMGFMDMPLEDRIAVGKRWHAAGGQLADVWDEDLPMAHYVINSAKVVHGNFSVRWEGQLTAPQNGEYTFSASPIDVNAVYRSHYVDKSMSVTIDGQKVIYASSDAWDHTSDPVSLQAGAAVPIEVNVAIQSSARARGVLHAILSWSGPGISETPIPSTQFSPPDGEGNGLQATYTWKEDGQFQRLTRTDAQIDFSWSNGHLGLSEDTSVQQQTTQSLWARTMAVDYLDGLESSEELHPFLSDPHATSAGLSSAQRKQFLQEVVQRPSLLRLVEPKRFWNFYMAFRIGAADAALDVVGVWAIQNADHCAVMAPDTSHTAVDIYFRDCCRRIGHLIAHQTNQANTLRDQHVELASGSCCLPIAYILGYSYLAQGKIDEWIALLDAKLEQAAVSGDKRVNWLLARAQAEEIRLGTTKEYATPRERLLAGRRFLDEAVSVARDAACRCRCSQELAARLSAMRQFDKSRSVLQAAVSDAPAELQQDLTDLLARLDGVQSSDQRGRDKQSAESRQAYRETLLKRRQRASDAGNSDAVARYDRLLQALPEPDESEPAIQ